MSFSAILLLEKTFIQKTCISYFHSELLILLIFKFRQIAFELYKMLRGKIRMHTCRIILLTSFVWFLLDIALLFLFSDSTTTSPLKSTLSDDHSNNISKDGAGKQNHDIVTPSHKQSDNQVLGSKVNIM